MKKQAIAEGAGLPISSMPLIAQVFRKRTQESRHPP
jgi:hypothetical protein